jgi:hypothetical protein
MIEAQQRIIDKVRLWHHETGPLAKVMKEEVTPSMTGHSYCVQLVALNFELSETFISIIVSF